MAKATPPADAAAGARGMQEGVGQRHADQAADVSDVPQQNSVAKSRPHRLASEITRRDVHTASSVNAQRRLSKSHNKEPDLARQAALQRAEGRDRRQPASSTAQGSPSTSKPVLVRKRSPNADMKRNRPSVNTSSPKLPSIDSFSFTDILASIGSEADASIEAIAEICGRSKMSLAEEHGSHRPPQGEFLITNISPAESLPSARLEPVEETASRRPHTRSRALTLARASNAKNAMSGDSTAATSKVTSHGQNITPSHGRDDIPSPAVQASLVPQIMAWLRGSNTDAGAVNALHNLLNAERMTH